MRNGDESLRDLERRAETGDREARVELHAALVEAGLAPSRYVAELLEQARRHPPAGETRLVIPLEGDLDLEVSVFPVTRSIPPEPLIGAISGAAYVNASIGPADRPFGDTGWSALVAHRRVFDDVPRKLKHVLASALEEASAGHAKLAPAYTAWAGGDRAAFPDVASVLYDLPVKVASVESGPRPVNHPAFVFVREGFERLLAAANRDSLVEATETGRFALMSDEEREALVDFPKLDLSYLFSVARDALKSRRYPFGFRVPHSLTDVAENAVAFAVVDRGVVGAGDVLVVGARSASPPAFVPAEAWPDELPSHYWDLERDKKRPMTDEARAWARRVADDRLEIPLEVAEDMLGSILRFVGRR